MNMHKIVFLAQESYNNSGSDAESAVTPTVIVVLSLISSASCATALIVMVLYTIS